MIQPIGALSPRADFRGHGIKREKASQERSKAQVALINATGLSVLAGALTTIVSRGYTSSWAHAGIFGACSSLLSMFFFAPSMIENTTLFNSKKKHKLTTALGKDSTKAPIAVKGNLTSLKKLIPFGQQS